MKKSTILLITALATAAFFAHSPEAKRLGKNDWTNLIGHHASRPEKLETEGADARATLPRDPESLSQSGDTVESGLHASSLASEQSDASTIDPELENDKLAQVAAEVPDDDLRRALDSSL